MINLGLSVDEVAPRIRFGFSLGSTFFMEIAKLRAARLLWAQVVAAFGGDARSQKMTLHARTSSFNKTLFDPYVNMLRVTSEGFSGTMGGADSMHLAPFDEPARTPDRFSRRIARNVQILLQEESNFTMPIDAPGGAYYIEKLTHKFGQVAWKIFQAVEEKKGMKRYLALGIAQMMCAATAGKREKAVETRSDVILGTNMYANLVEKKIEVPIIDRAALKAARKNEVGSFQRQYQRYALGNDLNEMEKVFAATGSAALNQAIVAFNNGATLGDIGEVLAEIDDERLTVQPLKIFRLAESFEKLRYQVEERFAEENRRVRIFLANMGPIPQHKPRADFSRGFFEVAGFEVLGNDGFETVDAAADAALACSAPVMVVCSTDATYPDYVPQLAARIKAARPDITLIVAGKQSPEVTESLNACGVDDYIHVRANCFEINKKLHEKYME